MHEARYWRAFSLILQRFHKISDWMAGAGGIEPPNGGIKIPCLTAWLRPNGSKCTNQGLANFASPDDLQIVPCLFNRPETPEGGLPRFGPPSRQWGDDRPNPAQVLPPDHIPLALKG